MLSAMSRLWPSSFGARSTSSSRGAPPPPWRCGQPRRSRSCSRWRWTRLQWALSPTWRDRGGNVTGLSALSPETASKRLEILREVVPSLGRVAVLGNVGNAGTVDEIREVQAAAQTLGVEVDRLEIRRPADIAVAFERLTSGAQALYVCPDALVNANRARIGIFALGMRLPTMFGFREYVDPAGLMSYGPHIPDLSGVRASLSIRFCAAQGRATFRSSSRRSLS